MQVVILHKNRAEILCNLHNNAKFASCRPSATRRTCKRKACTKIEGSTLPSETLRLFMTFAAYGAGFHDCHCFRTILAFKTYRQPVCSCSISVTPRVFNEVYRDCLAPPYVFIIPHSWRIVKRFF